MILSLSVFLKKLKIISLSQGIFKLKIGYKFQLKTLAQLDAPLNQLRALVNSISSRG